MTLPVWQGLAARESSGDIVVLASPSVTVTDRTTGAQPNLFSDRDGNTGIGNPFTANPDGSIEFYVAPGRYKVVATKGGETVTWENQLIGTVHGAEHLWKLATVGIITVDGNASSPIDDAYSADLGGNLSDGDTFRARIANRNETTTPTFENTGGTPGALTITAYDGRPLWPGALEGDHRFQYEAGTSPETWLVLNPNEMGVVDPEHATDGSSPTNDEYVSAVNTDPPADGQVTTRDFRTANETPTPTLDGKTMTTKDGSALWAGAVSGVHDVQYDSGADTYLVLEPNPVSSFTTNSTVKRDSSARIVATKVSTGLGFMEVGIDEDDMASNSATAVPTQQSVKAYTDTQDATFEQQRAQAWVNFDGTGTVSIRDHYNVSSITDNGTGNYTVNFATNLADANYAAVASKDTTGSGEDSERVFNLTTSGFDIILVIAGSAGDASNVMAIVLGGN